MRRPAGTSTDRSTPAWPGHADGREPGELARSAPRRWSSPKRSAAGVHPDPSTTSTSCRSTPVRSAIAAAGRVDQRPRIGVGHNPDDAASWASERPGRGPVCPSTAVAAIEPRRPHSSSGRPAV